MLTPRFDQIPQALRDVPRWVCWRHEARKAGEGGTKIPFDARTGRRASSTDPATWCTFERAIAAYNGRKGRPNAFSGIGVVLDGSDQLAGIDIDHCVAGGVPDPQALALLEQLGAAYVELSPSGTGLRAFGLAEPLERGAAGELGGLKVEAYSSGRYLTVTGHALRAGPVAPLRGFKELAAALRTGADPQTGELPAEQPADMRQAALICNVLEGKALHDSTRDLAGSLVAGGLNEGQTVNLLRALLANSDAAREPSERERVRERWEDVPKLVRSAGRKYAPSPGAPAVQFGGPHPLASYVPIEQEPRPPRWVLPGFIGAGVVVIAGAHGVGKTTAMVPLALGAAGLHEPGWPMAPFQWRHVVYVSEDSAQASRIIAGLSRHLGLDAAMVRERVHLVDAQRLPPGRVAEVGATYRQQFTRTVGGTEVLPLVVLDTMAATLQLDSENDNAEASAALSALKQAFAGLPVWLIGHVAKGNLGRADVAGLTLRGASAFEADAHQTLFLVKEGEARWLVCGKVRFEPRWAELQVEAHAEQTMSRNEFGNLEPLTLRWAIARPAQGARAAVSAATRAQQQAATKAELRDRVMAAVEQAWQAGLPLNRTAVKEAVGGHRNAVVDCIAGLVTEGWLHEVTVPAAERVHGSKASFLVAIPAQGREAWLRGERLPPERLAIPPSWRRNPPVPTEAVGGRL